MVMAVSGNALADGNTLMETAQTKAKSVFSSVKTIIFIVGGFGLVGLAFQAIFGKSKMALVRFSGRRSGYSGRCRFHR